jgi:hypothetical protein
MTNPGWGLSIGPGVGEGVIPVRGRRTLSTFAKSASLTGEAIHVMASWRICGASILLRSMHSHRGYWNLYTCLRCRRCIEIGSIYSKPTGHLGGGVIGKKTLHEQMIQGTWGWYRDVVV